MNSSTSTTSGTTLELVEQQITYTLQEIDSDFVSCRDSASKILQQSRKFVQNTNELHQTIQIWNKFFNLIEGSNHQSVSQNHQDKVIDNENATIQDVENKENANNQSIVNASCEISSIYSQNLENSAQKQYLQRAAGDIQQQNLQTARTAEGVGFEFSTPTNYNLQHNIATGCKETLAAMGQQQKSTPLNSRQRFNDSNKMQLETESNIASSDNPNNTITPKLPSPPKTTAFYMTPYGKNKKLTPELVNSSEASFDVNSVGTPPKTPITHYNHIHKKNQKTDSAETHNNSSSYYGELDCSATVTVAPLKPDFFINNNESNVSTSQVLNDSAKEDLTTIVSVPVISIKGSNGRIFSTPRKQIYPNEQMYDSGESDISGADISLEHTKNMDTNNDSLAETAGNDIDSDDEQTLGERDTASNKFDLSKFPRMFQSGVGATQLTEIYSFFVTNSESRHSIEYIQQMLPHLDIEQIDLYLEVLRNHRFIKLLKNDKFMLRY